MNIKDAKNELLHTIQVYTRKDAHGRYLMPAVRQRPLLLIGPPGIGKTAIMEQVAKECEIGLVSYTITHHTRQSAVGLPVIVKKNFQGKEYSITEYTMSEIIASVYEKMEQTSCKEGILFIDEINCVSETLVPTMLQFLQNKTFGTHPVPEGWIIAAAGNPVDYNRSAREFDILCFLSAAPGRVFSREELMEQVWGYDYYGDLRAVDVAIRRLREKIEDEPASPRYIITKRGMGYYFADGE